MFSLLLLFPFSSFEHFLKFNSTVCVFLDFFKRFVKFLFKDFFHFHTGSFKVLHCATDMLEYSEPVVVECFASSEGILHWLLLIVFLCCSLGIWI